MNEALTSAVAPIIEFVQAAAFVGSRITCNPAPTDTDQDILVMIPAEAHSFVGGKLSLLGWSLGGSGDDDDDFESWTEHPAEGMRNIIITSSDDFYGKFIQATRIAEELNLMDKDKRKALFQGILYGNSCAPRFANANCDPEEFLF